MGTRWTWSRSRFNGAATMAVASSASKSSPRQLLALVRPFPGARPTRDGGEPRFKIAEHCRRRIAPRGTYVSVADHGLRAIMHLSGDPGSARITYYGGVQSLPR